MEVKNKKILNFLHMLTIAIFIIIFNSCNNNITTHATNFTNTNFTNIDKIINIDSTLVSDDGEIILEKATDTHSERSTLSNILMDYEGDVFKYLDTPTYLDAKENHITKFKSEKDALVYLDMVDEDVLTVKNYIIKTRDDGKTVGCIKADYTYDYEISKNLNNENNQQNQQQDKYIVNFNIFIDKNLFNKKIGTRSLTTLAKDVMQNENVRKLSYIYFDKNIYSKKLGNNVFNNLSTNSNNKWVCKNIIFNTKTLFPDSISGIELIRV